MAPVRCGELPHLAITTLSISLPGVGLSGRHGNRQLLKHVRLPRPHELPQRGRSRRELSGQASTLSSSVCPRCRVFSTSEASQSEPLVHAQPVESANWWSTAARPARLRSISVARGVLNSTRIDGMPISRSHTFMLPLVE